MTRITDAAALGRILDAYKSADWQGAYRAVIEALSDSHGQPVADLDQAVWLWINGAIKVNDNDGTFANFIRKYTDIQYQLRTGHSGANVQQASDEIALRFIADLLDLPESVQTLETLHLATLPRPDSGIVPSILAIGEIDAGRAASVVFDDDASSTGLSNYSPWAGTLLFTYLGVESFFERWVVGDTDPLKQETGTYDLVSIAETVSRLATFSTLRIESLWNGDHSTLGLIPISAESILNARIAANNLLLETYGSFAISIDIGASIFDRVTPIFESSKTYHIGTVGPDASFLVVNENELVNSGAGDDTLIVANDDLLIDDRSTICIIDGGDGTDTLSYERISDDVSVNLATHTVHIIQLSDSDDQAAFNIENVVGGVGDDTLIGDALGNRLEGGVGSDSVSGGEGNDTLDGGTGDNHLVGGSGRDAFFLHSEFSGLTTVEDDDGSLQLDGKSFRGVAVSDAAGRFHIDGYTGQQMGADLLLTRDVNPASQFLLKNFTSGDYGIVTAPDQAQLSSNAGVSARKVDGQSQWQSFTAGQSGRLIGVDARFATEIHDGLGRLIILDGVGTRGAVLFDSIVELDGPAGLGFFTNWAVDVQVIAGRQYTFQFVGLAGVPETYAIPVAASNPYAGGTFGISNNFGDTPIPTFDWVFKTYVDGSAERDSRTADPPRFGGVGADTIVGSVGDGTIDGREGNDSLIGSTADDVVIGGSGDDTLNGGGGSNTADYSNSTGPVSLNLLTGIANDGFGGVDRLVGFQNVVASAFADTITAGAGIGYLRGGLGDDTYFISSFDKYVYEGLGGGTDTVVTSLGSFVLPLHVENLVHTGPSNFLGTGNGLANRLTGSTGADTLDGQAGADIMSGDAGNDVYFVDNVGDVAFEASSRGGIDEVRTRLTDYTLPNNIENLTSIGLPAFNGVGNSLNNVITIGAPNNRNDTLSGGAGNDTLNGDAGSDLLFGGTGADRFIFDFPAHTTVGQPDRIGDFSDAQNDRIDLSSFGDSIGTSFMFTFIGTAAFSGRPGELRYTTTASGLTVTGDTNGDRVPDFAIELLGVSTVFSRDFIF